jgi:hypothetical protein
MLGFKQFVTEQSKPIEQGFVDQSGVPHALILKPKRIKKGYVDEQGMPHALILKPNRKALTEKVNEKWESENDNSHLGKNVDEVHRHLVSKDKTTDADKGHIRNYTEDSKSLNTTLYQNAAKGIKTERHVNGHDTKGIDAALSRNKLGHDLHVYTGTGFDPNKLASKHPERHIHLDAYTSTSIHKGIAKEFADSGDEHMHVIHLHLKKGQKGKYIAHHSPGNEEEHEFLLPRNTTIKLHPEPTIHHDSYGSKYHVWHAHVVDQK